MKIRPEANTLPDFHKISFDVRVDLKIHFFSKIILFDPAHWSLFMEWKISGYTLWCTHFIGKYFVVTVGLLIEFTSGKNGSIQSGAAVSLNLNSHLFLIVQQAVSLQRIGRHILFEWSTTNAWLWPSQTRQIRGNRTCQQAWESPVLR